MISPSDILKARILVVDDQVANVALLEQVLQGGGYEFVSSTRDPREVGALYREHRHDLILLDLQMPGRDGFQVMEDLKEIETGGYLPVLAITAQPTHKLRALKAGAKDFISKPFDLAEVLLRVHNMIEVRLLHLESQRLYEQVVAEKKAADKLLLFFRSGPLAMSINSVADGRIIDANDEHRSFYGYTREEIEGNTLREHSLWANPDDRVPLMEQLLKHGAMRGFEAKQRCRSGETRDVLVSLELINQMDESEPVFISMIVDITERKRAEAELARTHRELLETSRLAGMAEVASGVLHNVGNVLNSVNVSSSCLAGSFRRSKVSSLTKVVALLREHETDLPGFLTTHNMGRQLPDYLGKLSDRLVGEQEAAIKDLALLQENIEHIKDIVAMQQNFAKVSGNTETLLVADVVEEALRIESCRSPLHTIVVTRDFEPLPSITADRHKVLQILVNLLGNAKDACAASELPENHITLRLYLENGRIHIAVRDNGVGILPENLTRIFAHGFTTKRTGHGFGLHSSALAAREMGGSLAVHSDGPGRGATFTLKLLLTPTDTPDE